MFAGFERGDRHRRMHVRRRADPDDVEIGNREQIGPVPHWRRAFAMFFTELFAALVSRIRDRDDLDIGILLQRGKMSLADNTACADDSDPQLLIILLCHVSNPDVDLALRLTIARAKF